MAMQRPLWLCLLLQLAPLSQQTSDIEQQRSTSDASRAAQVSSRSLFDIAAEPGWNWPDGSFLKLDGTDIVRSTLEVRAGEVHKSISVHLPSSPCAEKNTTGTGMQSFHFALHFHDSDHIEVLLTLTASSNASLFFGPSLDDGYEITLASLGNPNISQIDRKRDNITIGSSLGAFPWICHKYDFTARENDVWCQSVGTKDGYLYKWNGGEDGQCGDCMCCKRSTQQSMLDSTGATQLWLSFRLRLGAAELRVGRDNSFEHGTEVLTFFDGSPPEGASHAMHLWVATGGATPCEWQLCPAGVSEAVLTSTNHPAPMLKLVHADAIAFDCRSTIKDAPVPDASSSSWPISLHVSDNRLISTDSFSFMQGGRYRLCYTPDAHNKCSCSAATGTCNCTETSDGCAPSVLNDYGDCKPFGTRNPAMMDTILFTDVLVLGLSSSCASDGCLARERWDCFFEHFGESTYQCYLDFTGESGRPGWNLTAGTTSRATWSEAFGEDSLNNGILQFTNPASCASGAPAADQFAVHPDNASVELLPRFRQAPSLPRVRSNVRAAFTVALCYCPSFVSGSGDACSERQDYVQQFGRLYMWLVSICDGNDYLACAVPYLRVVPQQFVTKIICPPSGGCSSGTDNRIKFLETPRGEPSRPNWDSNNLCQRRQLESSRSVSWPEQSDSLNVDGGSRVDEKLWQEKQVKLSASTQTSFHVCYCNSGCDSSQNWLQVGTVRTVTAYAFASTTVGVGATPIKTVEYVNKPGSFSLYGGVKTPRSQSVASPYDSSTYLGDSVINLLSLDHEMRTVSETIADLYSVRSKGSSELQGGLEDECRRQRFSSTLVEGLMSAEEAADHRGRAEFPSQTLSFAGEQQDQTIRVLKAGTLAVCYCGSVTPSGQCLTATRWFFAGLLQIRGPRGGQTWVLPTRVVVAIHDVQGWGLHHTNKLRVIDRTTTCDAIDRLENKWSPVGSTSFKVGCPAGSNTSASCSEATEEHLISVQMANSHSTGIRITGLYIEGPHSSILTFSGPIVEHVSEGDAIMLDPESLEIDGSQLSAMTESQKFDAFSLSGMGQFQDDPSKTFLRHWHYVSFLDGSEDGGVQRSQGRVSNKLRIPIGWPADHPGGVPNFTFPLNAASSAPPQWLRPNLLSTQEELKANSTVTRLTVCWAPWDENRYNFYAEAGIASFSDPQFGVGAKIALTTKVSGAKAPVIISFSPSASRIEYRQSVGEMVLTLRFLDISKLAPVMVTGDPLGPTERLPAGEMNQATCGNLFMELWSDSPHGFPVPKGCFFTEVGANGEPSQRELSIVFDRFNGIRTFCAATEVACVYHIVLNARATNLEGQDEVVEIDSGCLFQSGGCNSRYEIFERVPMELSRPAAFLEDASVLAGTEQGQFPSLLEFPGGFELLSEDTNHTGNVFNLANQQNLSARLRASGLPGIQKGSILRIYLTPLTQWNLNPGPCEAYCIPSGGTICGALECAAEQLLPSEGLQSYLERYAIIKLKLPEDMTTIVDLVSPVVTTPLPAPIASIFPTFFGVQLTSPSDRNPNYVQSSGYISYLGRQSSLWDGRIMRAGREGSGPSPFTGQKNLLYAQITFGATLWRRGNSSAQTFLEITPPPGFACHVEADGRAPHVLDFEPGQTLPQLKFDRSRTAPFDGQVETLLLLDRDLDDFPDVVRGTLSVGSGGGSWQESLGAAPCRYVFVPGQKMHAGQIVLIALNVLNPSVPYSRAAPSNRWSVVLSGSGFLEQSEKQAYTTDSDTSWLFTNPEPTSANADLWVGNTAVLKLIGSTSVQPESLTAGAQNYLSVFVGITQDTGSPAMVVLDAPLNFSFTSKCYAEDFTTTIYDPIDAPGSLRPLPVFVSPWLCHEYSLAQDERWCSAAGVLDGYEYKVDLSADECGCECCKQLLRCEGAQSPDQAVEGSSRNRAIVRVGGNLRAGRVYGFRILVKNRPSIQQDEEGREELVEDPGYGFFLWTADSNGYPVDSSMTPVVFIEGEHGSWQLYREVWPQPPSLYVASGALHPYFTFRIWETLVVESLTVAGAGLVHTSLRIIAPEDCQFLSPSEGGFLLPTATLEEQLLGIADTPLLKDPFLASPQQQCWQSLELQAGISYGFRLLFKVDMPSSIRSGRNFFLELGYNASFSGRLGALSVPAPPVRAVLAAPLGYTSCHPGAQQNVLTFYFHITSEVPVTGSSVLVLRAGAGLKGMSLSCPVEARIFPPRPGFLRTQGLPAGTACSFYLETASDAPLLLLQPSIEAIPPGSYALDVKALNPLTFIGSQPNWTIGIYHNFSQVTLQGNAIDAPANARGFMFRDPMPWASLLPEALGTERWPLKTGKVMLAFELPDKSPPMTVLTVRAPAGFFFRENCLEDVQALTSEGHSVWPAMAIADCFGSGPTADAMISPALDPGRYSFRVEIQNPVLTPENNFWMLEYGLFASEPLDGYPLAEIRFPLALQPITQGSGQQLFAPLLVHFLLHQPVPVLGRLDIAAPPSFQLGNATRLVLRRKPIGLSILSQSVAVNTTVRPDGSSASVRILDIALLPGFTYSLSIMVKNPTSVPDGVGQWSLASFDPEEQALDEGAVGGFEVYPAIIAALSNIFNDMYSNQPVTLETTLIFRAPLLFEDVILLQAPEGFPLEAKRGLCRDFEWRRWNSNVLAPTPQCFCFQGFCELKMTAKSESWKQERENEGVAYLAEKEMTFRFSSVNPPRSQPLEQSYWRIIQQRKDLLQSKWLTIATSVLPCWTIGPQLQAATIELVGSSQAAGAVSDILLRFVPASLADAARLTAKFPPQVSFTSAVVQAPQLKGASSGGPVLVITGLGLVVGIEASLLISAVQLGRGGGQTLFDLQTFETGALAKVVDERLGFEGFFQSGHVAVEGVLQSLYSGLPEVYPVLSTLPARSKEEGRVILRLTFTSPLQVGDFLLVTCEGSGAYRLIVDARVTFSAVDYEGTSENGRKINVDARSHGDNSMNLQILSASGVTTNQTELGAAQPADLVFWTIPTVGVTTWKVETYRGPMLTNTNDGTTAGFAPVIPLQILLAPDRSPPSTVITVNLRVVAEGNPSVPELKVIAPAGFAFPPFCGELCAAFGELFGDTGRPIAKLSASDTTSLLDRQLVFVTKTPLQTPQRLTWIIEAVGSAGESMGWGSVTGFKVNQMKDTQVLYGGVANMVEAQLAFIFTFTQDPADQLFTIIEVGGPASIVMSCSGNNLRSLSLPGKQPTCDLDGRGQVRLVLDETLRPATYSFTIGGTLPEATPSQNIFSLVIREQSSEDVVDACFGLAGWPTLDIQATQPTLAWSTAGYDEVSRVTLAFSLDIRTDSLRALIMTLPDNHFHRVRTASDMTVSNKRLPLLKGAEDWLDNSDAFRLRILLEPDDPVVDAGSYLFTFPVVLPKSAEAVPSINVWHLTLCNSRDCLTSQGQGVILSFPLAGFRPGDVSILETLRIEAASDAAGLLQVDLAMRLGPSASAWMAALLLWAATCSCE